MMGARERSGNYVYYYHKRSRQGSRLYKSLDDALQGAVYDYQTGVAGPRRIEYLDGTVVFNTEQLHLKIKEELSERQQS